MGSSSGCLFVEELFGTRGPETGVSPVPPSIRESKLKVPVEGVWMGTPWICVGPPALLLAMVRCIWPSGRWKANVLGRSLGTLLCAFSVGEFMLLPMLLMLLMLLPLEVTGNALPNPPGAVLVIGVCRDPDEAPVGVNIVDK